MATRSIAFRLNDKNREDKEIMDWLDKVVYEGEYYDSLTEAVKWAILCFVRGEIRFREEMSTMELMQEFVRDFAKQSKADTEQIMQDAVIRILATIISAMGQQTGGYVSVPAMMQMQGMNVVPIPSATSTEPTEPVKEMEELQDNNLELSDKPLDDGALASLSAMFGDDEED
ncbi:MAG: hypothetical protein IJX66_01515 [Lachnospiraceae bacterium]|nr:hypothetical protein [Bacteroides sp.]MBQ9134754.1 hypothetical protein [Lachnospiraceae bacterium]